MFNRKEFNERIQQEFEDFKEFCFDLEVEDVIELGYELFIKTILTSVLQNENSFNNEQAVKLSETEDVIDILFETFLNSDYNYEFEYLFENFLNDFLDNQNDENDEDII